MTRRVSQHVALLSMLFVVLMGTLPQVSSAHPAATDPAPSASPASSTAQQQPENNVFNATSTPLDPSTYPANANFAQARQALAASSYPANYNFTSGDLNGWTASDANKVHVLSDTNSKDGAYLHLDGTNQWALSSAFQVPDAAQSLRFDYWAWTPRNANENSRLFVEVFSGSDFSVYTLLGTLQR